MVSIDAYLLLLAAVTGTVVLWVWVRHRRRQVSAPTVKQTPTPEDTTDNQIIESSVTPIETGEISNFPSPTVGNDTISPPDTGIDHVSPADNSRFEEAMVAVPVPHTLDDQPEQPSSRSEEQASTGEGVLTHASPIESALPISATVEFNTNGEETASADAVTEIPETSHPEKSPPVELPEIPVRAPNYQPPRPATPATKPRRAPDGPRENKSSDSQQGDLGIRVRVQFTRPGPRAVISLVPEYREGMLAELIAAGTLVCVVNDNSSRLFRFQKLAQGETWVDPDAVSQVNALRMELRLTTNQPRYSNATPIEERALGSLKQTDLLVIGLNAVPRQLNLDPRRVEGRAALWSFGFSLRRAAAADLDINEWELRVGLRVIRDAQGAVVGQVFLSDALENGAGYCLQFSTPDAMGRLLRAVADPTGSFIAPLLAKSHSERCQTSCPDCLRDYSNLAWHNILDWRLAFDVARLALDANAAVDLNVPHWQLLTTSSASAYFQALGWNQTLFNGLCAARSGARAEMLVHPLWANNHPVLDEAKNEARGAGVTEPQEKTLFDVLRRPF